MNRVIDNQLHVFTSHTCTIVGGTVHCIAEFTSTNSRTIAWICCTIFCNIVTWTISC